jgi:hypothetical protein
MARALEGYIRTLLFFPRCSFLASRAQTLLLPQHLGGGLDFHHQPPGGLPVDRVRENRPGQLADGSLDGVEGAKSRAGTGEQFTTLLPPPPLTIRLFGVAVADGFAFHGRSLALLAVAAELPAAPVVGVASFGHLGW